MQILKLLDSVKRKARFLIAGGLKEPPSEPAFTPLNRQPAQMAVAISPPSSLVDITAPRKRLHDECYALGLKTGRESGRKDLQEPTRRFLEAIAKRKAETLRSQTSRLREELIQAIVRRLQNESERLIEARDVAIADLRDRKRERSELGPSVPCPVVSPRLVRGATLGFVLSLVPTAHDLLPIGSSFAWPIALIFGVGVAQLLVEGILPNGPSNPGRNLLRHGAFLASLALGGAFLEIRLEAASSALETGLAYGLSFAEMSVALILEAKAVALQPRINQWHEEEERRGKADLLIADAESELRGREERVRETEIAIERKLDEFEEISVLGDLDSLTNLAIDAVMQGYSEGVIANDVSIRGLARKEAANGAR